MRLTLAAALLSICLPSTVSAQALCENPNATCGALLKERCLQPLGAGAMSTSAVAAAPAPAGGCPGQLEAYQGCLQRAVSECGGAPALDLTALPSVSGSMLQSCLNPQTVQMICGGIPNKLTITLSSGDMHGTGSFAGYSGALYALSPDGGVEPLVDLNGHINGYAQYVQNIALGIPKPADELGACITFTPPDGDTQWGVVQAERLKGMMPAAMAQQMGGAQMMGQPISPRVAFETAKSDCAAEMRKLAKRYVR